MQSLSLSHFDDEYRFLLGLRTVVRILPPILFRNFRQSRTTCATTQCGHFEVDERQRAVEQSLGVPMRVVNRSAETRKSPETAEGRRRILCLHRSCGRQIPFRKLIIPRSGIVGSNPTPATTLNPKPARLRVRR